MDEQVPERQVKRKRGRPLGSESQRSRAYVLRKAHELIEQATPLAVQTLLDLLESKNEMVKLNAAKAILAKNIPDMVHDAGKAGDTTINIVYGAERPDLVQVFQRNGNANGQG